MVLRTEKHREWLMQIINAFQFTGANAEAVVELKAEVMTATIETPTGFVNGPAPTGNGSGAAICRDPHQAEQPRA